ncbi:(2Fe-2S)-binding protein [Rhizobium sp. NRK18]|uniref:(2Fe-2S)-binding protein n=1 Tax=Rhizobium sp. NRK18 TaxID=2964667 RepID=UPI0021C2D65D|nr:(2Fe-2S)-binding protein [Rhizobium sp. NRK18]MCQ2005276.1 hypothetical protein [Rhizobium sp. NRK18]
MPAELVRAWAWLGEASPLRLRWSPLYGDWFTVADLADPGSEALSTLLAYQRSFARGMDQRTQAAYLIGQYSYFHTLALAAALLREGVIPVFAPNALTWRLVSAEIGMPARLELGVKSASVRPASEGAVAPELERAFAPIIEALRARTGFGRRPQWRIAADSIASAFLDVGRANGDQAKAADRVEAIVKTAGSPFANDALAFVRVAASHGDASEIFRLRGGCCRYVKVEGGSLCPTCVLRDREEQLALLQTFMDERQG